MEKEKERSGGRYVVPAVEQAGRVLFCLADATSSHMSLTEIYAKVGIHKSKAFSILHTLQGLGLVQRNIDGKGYALGTGLIALSRRVLDNLNAPRVAEPILVELAKKSGGTAALGLIADKNVFVAAKQEGGRDIGYTMRIGYNFPLTYGSHGKAIAAFLPKEDLDKLLQNGDLYFHGKPNKFDRAHLEEELDHCRRDGYATDFGEMRAGINTVASIVFGPAGIPIGYIVVVGLLSKKATEKFGPAVAQAAKLLSRQLGADLDNMKISY